VTFWLGIHKLHWLAAMDVPAFVSYSITRKRKKFPRAVVEWCHDSRGFKELEQHGRYTFTAEQYASDVRRAAAEMGRMRWAAAMDWMCEPQILKKTGLSVPIHQEKTINNLLELRRLAPDIQWTPVLQGWEPGDYQRHTEMYERRGVSLSKEPVVGVGSVCRRQSTAKIEEVIGGLRQFNLRLHGFGVKVEGVARVGRFLSSADSMAWSFHARRRRPLREHFGRGHKNCANCLEYAYWWRHFLLVPRLRTCGWALEDLAVRYRHVALPSGELADAEKAGRVYDILKNALVEKPVDVTRGFQAVEVQTFTVPPCGPRKQEQKKP
jgi:hypothetical protein